MQGLHGYQVAAHAAADTARKRVALPSLQLYSDLPREWPMARLCISNKQVNRFVRTILWRRVAERALRETYFGDIPAEVNPAYIADLLRISEAFAAVCFCYTRTPTVFLYPSKATSALCLAVWPVSVCLRVLCLNNKHRRKNASAAKTAPSKQEEPSEKDVDALTFMQTIIMSFVRGMEHGEQTLPINDLFLTGLGTPRQQCHPDGILCSNQ